MGSCDILNEFPLGACYTSSGGLAKIYIANKANVVEILPTLDGTDDEGLITGITMASGTTYFDYTYQVHEQLCSEWTRK